ncbi:MAG: nitrous oxide reductase family maturation protein NosD [Candidatus Thorarchaeota archaeon]
MSNKITYFERIMNNSIRKAFCTFFSFIVLLMIWISSMNTSLQPLVVMASNDPPSAGDWVIENEYVVRENEEIILNGNLLIKAYGNLTLHNVTLLMNCSYDGEFRLEVQKGGNFTAEANSTVTSFDPTYAWDFRADAGSLIELVDSTFSHAGWEWSDNGKHSGLWINTENAQVIRCAIVNNEYGLSLYKANNSFIANNTIRESTFDAIFLWESNYNVISRNQIVNNSRNGIALYYSKNSTVIDNNLTNNSAYGLLLEHSHNVTADRNILTKNANTGIRVYNSSDCRISYNSINSELKGFYGIFLEFTDRNTISDNIIANSRYNGIHLGPALNSNITKNTVTNSSKYGLSLHQDTTNCSLWGNILANNAQRNAWDANGHNQWDNGTHGNWWDDYFGPDWNQDGVGDLPYDIPGSTTGVQDRFPLFNVTDSASPTIDHLRDFTYEVGTLNHSLSWAPVDSHPYWYNITRNGTIVAQGIWNGSAIVINVDGLAVGTYIVTVNVYDQLGNSVSDTVFVRVVDTSPITETETGTSIMSEIEETSEPVSGFTLNLLLVLGSGFLIFNKRSRIWSKGP